MSDIVLHILPRDEEVSSFYTARANHATDSGVDLYCPADVTIEPGQVQFVDMGVRCKMVKTDVFGRAMNIGYYLYARSSISKTSLMLANHVGVIDMSYRGSIIAALRNIGTSPYTIQKGDRLVQLCSPYLEPLGVQLVDSLDETERGSGGFGSTGK
jgi:dUTP pyrophosphatase